jgi:glycosyltransferase involved in cell wall biosynthesis
MTPPSVSIVLPTFNRLGLLRASVESVFRQTVRDWELIVADDGSANDVQAYLEELERQPRVRILRLAHSGNPGASRNAAIAVARAPLIAFLDSDDLWETTKLERQLAVMRANPECGWSYTAFSVIDGEGELLSSERKRNWTPHTGHIFAAVVRAEAAIPTPSVMVKTDVAREAGVFDEAIDCSEDYDLWMRFALQSPACVVDEPLVKVRRHPQNLQRDLSAYYLARDHSLRKLASVAGAGERSVLAEERSRNALAMSAAIAASGARWCSVSAVCASFPFSWRYPRWWYGAAKAVARAGLRRNLKVPR